MSGDCATMVDASTARRWWLVFYPAGYLADMLVGAGLVVLAGSERTVVYGACWLALLALGFVALRLLERSVLRLEAQREAEEATPGDLDPETVAQPRQRAAG